MCQLKHNEKCHGLRQVSKLIFSIIFSFELYQQKSHSLQSNIVPEHYIASRIEQLTITKMTIDNMHITEVLRDHHHLIIGTSGLIISYATPTPTPRLHTLQELSVDITIVRLSV